MARITAFIVIALLLGSVIAYYVKHAHCIRLFGVEILTGTICLLLLWSACNYIFVELPQYDIRPASEQAFSMNQIAAQELRQEAPDLEGDAVDILDSVNLNADLMLLCRYQTQSEGEKTCIMWYERNAFGWLKAPWIVTDYDPQGWTSRIEEAGSWYESVYEITLGRGQSNAIDAAGFPILLSAPRPGDENRFHVNMVRRTWRSEVITGAIAFLIITLRVLCDRATGSAPAKREPLIKRWHRGDPIWEVIPKEE